MSLSHETYADAARSVGWSPFTTLLPSDLPVVISHLRLCVTWRGCYVSVSQVGGVGVIERVSAGREADALFTAVVMCAALIGGATQGITVVTEHPPCATHAKGGAE